MATTRGSVIPTEPSAPTTTMRSAKRTRTEESSSEHARPKRHREQHRLKVEHGQPICIANGAQAVLEESSMTQRYDHGQNPRSTTLATIPGESDGLDDALAAHDSQALYRPLGLYPNSQQGSALSHESESSTRDDYMSRLRRAVATDTVNLDTFRAIHQYRPLTRDKYLAASSDAEKLEILRSHRQWLFCATLNRMYREGCVDLVRRKC